MTKGVSKELAKSPKKLSRRHLLFLNAVMLIGLLFGCESNDRYYRPNLPEKLCCVGIIDIDGTTHYLPGYSEFQDNRYSTRYISIEKSFQCEYPADTTDMMRDFSFTISDSEKEIFKYQSDHAIKNLLNYPLPDSLEFVSGERYFLKARERDTPEISAEIRVPQAPPSINLISFREEMIALTKPINGCPLNICDTIESAEIRISFDNDPSKKQFYMLILSGAYIDYGMGFPFSCFLNFDVRKSSSQGFFAEVQGLKVKEWYWSINGVEGKTRPLMAYFLDGSKISVNKCFITLSTKFHGFESTRNCGFQDFYIMRIKLLSIPEELYLFERSLYTYDKVKDDPFSEPVYLNGNLVGGNGVFALCRSTVLIHHWWYGPSE